MRKLNQLTFVALLLCPALLNAAVQVHHIDAECITPEWDTPNSEIGTCPLGKLEALELIIAPNPFTDVLRVELRDGTGYRVDLVEPKGKLVFSEHFDDELMLISAEELAAGNYLLNVIDSSGVRVHSQRLILSK